MPQLRVHALESAVRATPAQARPRPDREWTTGLVVFAIGFTIGALYAYVSAEWPARNPDAAVSPQVSASAATAPGSTPLPIATVTPKPEAVDTERAVAPPAARGIPGRNAAYRGTLMVNSQPRGARIFLNERYVGQTPMLIRALPAGSRAVRLRLDGYQPWSRGVSVVANETTTVAAKLNRMHAAGVTRR